MAASALMNVMQQAARKAGRRLVRDFGEVENLQVSVKSPSNFVSSADMRAEETLFEDLSRARPGYGFLMEERGAVEGADKTHRWIIDPIDGTTNFLHSIPAFAISIALEREGNLIAGLIYNPVTDECFTAEKGKGAFLNDRRIRVSSRRKLADCVVVTGVPHLGRGEHKRFLAQLEAVMGQVAGVRRTGSAALDLAFVAAGRFDGFWEEGLSPWDIAAGMLLVREAGGFISDLDGGQRMFSRQEIVAGNSDILPALSKLLRASA